MERIISKQIEYSHVDYIVNSEYGEFDTRVVLNSQFLCVIHHTKIDEFQNELKQLIERYKK